MITRRGGLLILSNGILMAVVGVAAFAVTRERGGDLEQARTAAFCTLAFTQLFFSFACRSWTCALPELGLFSNPYLFCAIAGSALLQVAVVTLPPARLVFDVPTGGGAIWPWMVPLALVPVPVVETVKLLRAWLGARRKAPLAREDRADVEDDDPALLEEES